MGCSTFSTLLFIFLSHIITSHIQAHQIHFFNNICHICILIDQRTYIYYITKALWPQNSVNLLPYSLLSIFYFTFLINKIIIRGIYFRRFYVISIKNWAGLLACLIISIILGFRRLSACCGSTCFRHFIGMILYPFSLPINNWMLVWLIAPKNCFSMLLSYLVLDSISLKFSQLENLPFLSSFRLFLSL